MLQNNCNFAVGMTLSNFPHNGVDYTGDLLPPHLLSGRVPHLKIGPAIPDIPAKSSHDITVPVR
jgi:hypothetical protein